MAKLVVIVVDSARRESRRNHLVEALETDPGRGPIVIGRNDLAVDPSVVLRPRGPRARLMQDLDLARGALIRLQDETERASVSLKLTEAELASQRARVERANEHLAATQTAANAGLAAREAAQQALKDAQDAIAELRATIVAAEADEQRTAEQLTQLVTGADAVDRYAAWLQEAADHPTNLLNEGVRSIKQVRDALRELLAVGVFDAAELAPVEIALGAALDHNGPMHPIAAELWDRLTAAEREREKRIAGATELAAEKERAMAALAQLDADLAELRAQQKPVPSPELISAIEAAHSGSDDGESGFGRKRKKGGDSAATMLAEAGWDSYLDFHLARSQGFNDSALATQIQRAEDRRTAAEQWLLDVETKIAQNDGDADAVVTSVLDAVAAVLGEAALADPRAALAALQQPPVVPPGLRVAIDVELARVRAAVASAATTRDQATADLDVAESALKTAKATVRDAQRRALAGVNELESERALVRAAEAVRADLEARVEELRRQAGTELDRHRDAELIVQERLDETADLRTSIRRALEGELPALADSHVAELDRVRDLLWQRLPDESTPAEVVLDDAFSELDGAVALRLIVTLSDLYWPATYLTDDPLVVAWAQSQERLHADPAISVER
ncbi:MAG: hypothetical protein AB7L13_01475 [Acidimicrobiia bacterium]